MEQKIGVGKLLVIGLFTNKLNKKKCFPQKRGLDEPDFFCENNHLRYNCFAFPYKI